MSAAANLPAVIGPPDPPVPAECSTFGNDWFPLYFERLRKSKWWRRASDLARARNVMLWGAAYESERPGSLPDDDDELAEAAGFGLDTAAFLAVKAELLDAWVLCSDGRWYHPVVCEMVLQYWERASKRRKSGAERQRRHRVKLTPVTSQSEKVTRDADAVTPGSENVTRDNAPKPVTPRVRARGLTGQDKDKDKTSRSEANASALVGEPDVRSAFDAYNDVAQRLGLPIAKTLTPERRDKIRARLRQSDPGAWDVAMAELAASPWLQGRGDRGWKADLDFVLQAKSFNRLIEGFYRDLRTDRSRGEQRAAERDDNARRAAFGLAGAVARQRGGLAGDVRDDGGGRGNGGAVPRQPAVPGPDRSQADDAA